MTTKNIITALATALLFNIHSSVVGQEIAPPLDFDLSIAGNYGELRPSHFHAGLDFKTQQSIGHPVHSFADGYVERVGINAYGYGLVLYVTHPEMERMTVYGHLDTFSEKIWKKVRERQVNEELNNADITFGPEDLPVKMGEVIALSGNTGSSGGPHVHFEVRGLMSAPGADDEEWYDPMPYFKDKLRDTTAPKISNLYIYTNPNTAFTKHTQILNRTTEAWGKVGFAIKAYDYMDGQSNKYGVKRVKLYCDDQLIYNWNQEFFQYSEQRYTNSVIDYAEYVTLKSTIMKTYVEPGNHLRMIDHSIGDGIVDICEERPYNFRYELEDAHGNKATLPFVVNGVRKEVSLPNPVGRIAKADSEFKIDSLGIRFHSPAGNLYCDADISFSTTYSSNVNYLSPIFTIGNPNIPLHGYCDLEISLPDSIISGEQLHIVNLNGGAHKCRYTPAQAIPFSDRILPPTVKTRVRDFGRFVVRRDTEKPEATLVGNPTISAITLTLSDIGSGVASWKVYIDGKFVPFDMNNKGRIVGCPNKYGITPGTTHSIEIHVTDLVGNESIINLNKRF